MKAQSSQIAARSRAFARLASTCMRAPRALSPAPASNYTELGSPASHPVSNEHPHTAIALHAVGQELRRQGKYAEALEHYNRALAVQQTILGSRHPHTASTLTALGQILHHQGDHHGALDHHRQALAIKREHLGDGHLFTANSLYDLGQTLQVLGQRSEALASYVHALGIQQSALGPGHPRTIATQQAIGELQLAQGQFDDALIYFRDALAGLDQLRRPDPDPEPEPGLEPGPDRRPIPILLGIGQALYQQNQYPDAIAHYERALALCAPDHDHDDALTILHDLGRAHSRAGDQDAALVAFQRNLAGLRARLGEDDAKVAATLNAIGQVHFTRSDHRAALDHYRQALEIRQRVLGLDHWQTATSRFNCGTAARELGEPTARADMESAAADLERLLGPGHPHVLATRPWLG